uniref:DoxX family protein n=1 Tax=Prevotella sp. GTC17254 TaxID=3236794 RepID=A0AB33J5I3_9BACT
MKKLMSFLFPSDKETPQVSIVLALARVVFGLLLASHGWQKLMGFSAMSTQFPDPIGLGSEFSLALAIFGELVCSVAFVFGFLSRLVVIPMIFTMLVAFATVHHFSVSEGELVFVYLMVYLLLLLTGPGQLSIDGWIGRRLNRR